MCTNVRRSYGRGQFAIFQWEMIKGVTETNLVAFFVPGGSMHDLTVSKLFYKSNQSLVRALQ